MINQTSLFESPEVAAYKLIEPRLRIIICTKNWLSLEHLKLLERKQFYSVQFDSTVILRIYSKPTPKISIASNTSDSGFEDYKLPDLRQITDYEERIAEALQYAIDQLPTEYSCCSRYEECSNAKGCTNPHEDIAIKCSYRKKLQKGIIFYGVNRNIV